MSETYSTSSLTKHTTPEEFLAENPHTPCYEISWHSRQGNARYYATIESDLYQLASDPEIQHMTIVKGLI